VAKRSQFGSVRRLPSGRFQARYTIPGTDTVVTAPMTFTTKQDAETWLAVQRADLARGTWKPPDKRKPLLVGEYAERWLTERNLRPTTAAHYRRMLDRFVLPSLADIPLGKLTPEMIRTWWARLDTGPVYRARVYSMLSTLCTTAVEDGLIPSSPCVIRGAGKVKRKQEIKLPTLEELTVIVGAMTPAYRLLVLLAAWCGLRYGELAELRRKDIDVKAGVIRVRRGVTWVDGDAIIGRPKSEAGIRDVNIPPHLIPVVIAHLKEHAGIELLFPSPRGHQMRHQDFWPHWDAARTAADRRDLHVHHLRHLGATLAAQSGATVRELMARLGHSTPQMSMQYQHWSQQRDKEIAAKLSELAARDTPM
jgi:integrase